MLINGGEGGIRTPVTIARKSDFESDAFDHSATSPGFCGAKNGVPFSGTVNCSIVQLIGSGLYQSLRFNINQEPVEWRGIVEEPKRFQQACLKIFHLALIYEKLAHAKNLHRPSSPGIQPSDRKSVV